MFASQLSKLLQVGAKWGMTALGTVAPMPVRVALVSSFLSAGTQLHKVQELHHRDSTVSTPSPVGADICGPPLVQAVHNPVTSGFA